MLSNPHYYWSYGGMFAAQPMVNELLNIEKAYLKYREDPVFLEELLYYFTNYCGRPTALTYADRLSQQFGVHIYLKREDMTNIGAHKINHSIYQGLLAQRLWKTELIAETGAGMHGVSVATVGAMLGMKVKVFMGEEDMRRQEPNVMRMRLLGAEVVVVRSGSKTLKDAVNEAMKYYMNNMTNAYFLLWSTVGPAPYPQIVREAQSVIWREARKQFTALTKKELPDYAVACVGGGCNSIWLFSAYLDDPSVKLIGVEWWGRSTKKIGEHASRFEGVWACDWIFQWFKSIFLQDDNGNIAPTHSISAWLDYPGVWPEHAYLHSIGRVMYTSASDQEVIDAFLLTAQTQGILPALESTHALAYLYYDLAPKIKDSGAHIIVNLSWRWDKDLHTVQEYLDQQKK